MESTEGGFCVATSAVYDLLVSLVAEILQTPVDPKLTLIAQGLDSMGAVNLLEELHEHGYEADYEYLLSDASIESLASALREKTSEGPVPAPENLTTKPVVLTGPQAVWANLEQLGWGSWANISLCLSMPASLISAAFLPAIAQSVCDANDAMRMVLTKAQSDDSVILQKSIPNFQLPVQVREAPGLERDAMRLIEAFEGEQTSPFEPSTRALILSSATEDGRHWLCVSMHHIFSDRISMQNLARQIIEMIAKSEFSVTQKASIGYIDYAIWRSRFADGVEIRHSQKKLEALLAGANLSPNRPIPHLASKTTLDLGNLPTTSSLRPFESEALEKLAVQLKTTLPLFLHALFSVLVTRLTGNEQAASGETDMLLCHVVSNRERHASLKNLVGCLDTSVPVAVRLAKAETLDSLCSRTRRAFAEAYKYASDLPRGGWTSQETDEASATPWASLFEKVPHINIIRTPHGDQFGSNDLGIREHSVRRTQKTRWGLLLRVTLPHSESNRTNFKKNRGTNSDGIRIKTFAENPAFANVAQYCFVELLRTLLSQPTEVIGDLPILEQIDLVVNRASFASTQVRNAAALVSSNKASDAFIYDKLVARQQRWYEHNERYELRRDEHNRFIGTAANPFPFTQLDKLRERRFLEDLGAPLPRLLNVLPKEGLQDTLLNLAPSLPDSFVIKPVGAGHSFGVTLVRNGIDLTRNGVPFDVAAVAGELLEMAERGFCIHEEHVFPFNFSSFLIEELVIDERGFHSPTDYKVFMIGSELLWIQLHFKESGHNWVAFVDADFELLPQPAWDPITCWRTHRALVCTEQTMASARKPKCLSGILEHSKRLADHLGIFVRLDWYADKTHGPLMGEITTFPHMLQPRSFYTSWANDVVKAAWQDPDGVAPPDANAIDGSGTDLIARTEEQLNKVKLEGLSLEDLLPSQSQALWAIQDNVSYDALHTYVADFDLASWGVTAGERVALLVSNGVQLGALLLATMNRYIALPIGSTLPTSLITAQLQQSRVKTLVVIAQTDEARKAHEAARQIPDLVIVELSRNRFSPLASLPPQPNTVGKQGDTPVRGHDDDVLVLRTSGSTGEPKSISFTLAKLMRSGAIIGQSLQLSPADLGISMLPLHHVGGIACNIIAPTLAGAPMSFCTAFNPKAFFDALTGKQGATWCYMVPAMWEMVLEYSKAHPELQNSKPWPRLRVIRSAGSELTHNLARELANLFGDTVSILPTYGMTEAMPIASPPLSYRLDRPGSVGRALPTVSIEIVDHSDGSQMAAVADGLIGEVTVKGPTVLEYYEHSDRSPANDFTPRGYFRTGDLGSLAADGSGWLFVNGRIKDAINRGGETIAPGEIEAVLRSYPSWQGAEIDAQVMVFARKHTTLGEDVALAVAVGSAKADLAQINAWAQQHLPAFMLPQTLVLLSELPRSDAGKLLRARFAEHVNSHIASGNLGTLQTYAMTSYNAVPRLLEEADTQLPENNLYETGTDVTLDAVLTVVRNYLDHSVEVGPDTRLDDAGVNSLAAVELSGLLNDRFKSNLPTWVISDYPTPQAIFSQLINTSAVPSRAEAASEKGKLRAPVQLSEPKRFRANPLRVLFLHGEGADADLMDLSLQATHWTGHLEELVEFVFMEAPHLCPPKPEFHATAVEARLYEKKEYRSWGATDTKTLEESIGAVTSALDELGPIDAIGGICDGGLVAALVASQRSDLKLYLNFSSSPITRLPSSVAESAWTISCPSIHLVSRQDELHSFAQQLEISERCKKSLLLQHDRGHAVPMLDENLKGEFEAVLTSIDSGYEQHAAASANFAPVYEISEGTGQKLGVKIVKDPQYPNNAILESKNGQSTQSEALVPNSRFRPVSIAKIEKLVSSHERVESAIVVEAPGFSDGGNRLVGFVVINPDSNLPPPDLRAYIKAKVPIDLLPERFVPIDAVPLTGDGSIDQSALVQKIPKTANVHADPSSSLEEELVKIWQEILMMDHAPGIDDDFFELGGYSLLSVILLRETERHLGRKLPKEALLNLSTIRKLAKVLEASGDDEFEDSAESDGISDYLEKSGLSAEIWRAMLAHTVAWKGKRSCRNSLIFGLNSDGSKQPIFWCFQRFGSFSQLAKHLGPNQPVYGMRSGVEVMEKSQSNIENLARYYAHEILSIQPSGPFIIGGTCQSAKIVFQIARELQRQGQKISLLCLHEQVVPLKYFGRVALFFGDKSDHNPAYYFENPEESWQAFYSSECSVNTTTSNHSQYFQEPHVQMLAGMVQAEIENARINEQRVEEAALPTPTPILLPGGRQAEISTPKHSFLVWGKNKLRINVKVTNTSTEVWPANVERGIKVGYWVYGKKKIRPPVFYGLGKDLTEDLAPGQSVTIPLDIAVPIRPGRYRVEIDMSDNDVRWFRFDGSPVATIILDARLNIFTYSMLKRLSHQVFQKMRHRRPN
ncbi:MAG: AMP-binding protein [Hyphomicrobiales bacterium]